ncbi:MAG: sigma-70 family RNA polymerase sigma factor [Anaerolineae bacterium]|nr:sigma-70 family RNA polymerase sigma factor [Anaerolineae bacterium]
MTSEHELLERARQFDLAALGIIYDQYSPALYRYAARLLGNADAAEECVAEVFSRFLHALKNGGGPREHLQAYLYRIAHNWITDQWRRAPPVTSLAPDALDELHADPERTLGRAWEHARVRAALAQLTPDQRQVIVLKFVEELDNATIAAALNKPIGAIKSLQHRALAALRRALDAQKDAE